MFKPTKKLLLLLGAFALLAGTVYAFTVLLIFDVVPPGNCRETDTGIDFFTPGHITGNFSVSGQNYNGTFSDACLSSTSIVELVCGGTINPKYNHLGAAILEDCATFNKTCKTFGGESACA